MADCMPVTARTSKPAGCGVRGHRLDASAGGRELRVVAGSRGSTVVPAHPSSLHPHPPTHPPTPRPPTPDAGLEEAGAVGGRVRVGVALAPRLAGAAALGKAVDAGQQAARQVGARQVDVGLQVAAGGCVRGRWVGGWVGGQWASAVAWLGGRLAARLRAVKRRAASGVSRAHSLQSPPTALTDLHCRGRESRRGWGRGGGGRGGGRRGGRGFGHGGRCWGRRENSGRGRRDG